MSTHALPAGVSQEELALLLSKYLRPADGWATTAPGQPATAVVFTPDLSAAEVTTLGKIFSAAQAGADVAPADADKVTTAIGNLRQFAALTGTPTAAQQLAALRNLTLLVRSLFRDQRNAAL